MVRRVSLYGEGRNPSIASNIFMYVYVRTYVTMLYSYVSCALLVCIVCVLPVAYVLVYSYTYIRTYILPVVSDY